HDCDQQATEVSSVLDGPVCESMRWDMFDSQTATSGAINRRLMSRCQSMGPYVSHPARRK
ncbi:hypothetical protein, partial [Roseiconus lacunae]|uniref:hypothetical protein n=1 Tax=Roseiconus lacunae TaxID=2605694 RepID=UPI00193F51A8